MGPISIYFALLCVIAFQFLIILHLFVNRNSTISVVHSTDAESYVGLTNKRCPKGVINADLLSPPMPVSPHSVETATAQPSSTIKGVAMTMMLHRPTWFQRRYTIMIQNIINNIPADWKVQIFHTGVGQSKNGIDINRGLQRFLDSGTLVLTLIPEEIWKVKNKRKQFELMVEPWIWENVLAEDVLVFGGNGVICSNSPYSIDNFTEFDYIGAPWMAMRSWGGDGSTAFSFRKRRAMLATINYELSKQAKVSLHRQSNQKQKTKTTKKQSVSWGQEDIFFVSRMLEMQQKGLKLIPDEVQMVVHKTSPLSSPSSSTSSSSSSSLSVSSPAELHYRLPRLAPRNECFKFSSVGSFLGSTFDTMEHTDGGGSSSVNSAAGLNSQRIKNESFDPENFDPAFLSTWSVSGPLPDVPYAKRAKFMEVCPEMKLFYPALHDPSCFGASPNGTACARTVCALRPGRRGGCI